MQRVNTAIPVTAVALTPLARVIRTIIQVVLAVGASIPITLATTGLTGVQITKVESIVASGVAVISVIQNLLEHFGVLPAVGGNAPLTPSAK